MTNEFPIDFSFYSNYINSYNKLLNIICKGEDYMLFNKSYLHSLNDLLDNFIDIKGYYPKAIVISEEDKMKFNAEVNECEYLSLVDYVYKYLGINCTFITTEKAIKTYLKL